MRLGHCGRHLAHHRRAPPFPLQASGAKLGRQHSLRTTCERVRGLAADDRNRAGSERELSGGPDDCVSSSVPVVWPLIHETLAKQAEAEAAA
jgi:hypothetical protein